MRIMERISRLRRRFALDDRASVGMIFGLTLVPVTALTGAALDYSRASLVRNELQSAVDAAALALAKDAVAANTTEAFTRAQAVFRANFPSRFESVVQSLTVTRLTDSYRVEARARVQFAVMQLMGASSTDVSATGTSSWGINKIEIALVLDNTGSMGSANKMQELKKALCGDTTCSNTSPTAGFIKLMKDAAMEADQIRVALVPFDTTVRVPLGVQNAVNAGSNIAATFAYTGAGYCSLNTTAANRVSWSLASAPATSWFRFANRDKDTTAASSGCGTGRTSRGSWQGCLWDRDQDSNRDTVPTGVDPLDVNTLYPAVNCRSNSLARMAPLVDVRTNTANLVTSLALMQPSGNTNVTIGATWGVNMLSPGFPMSTAAPAQDRLSRYMVLLTDGDNTENRQTGSSTSIDARTRLACANARAQGITVYAVRVIDGNRDLLRECASGPANYYEVSNASQLTDVFASIAGRIGSIRLTN